MKILGIDYGTKRIGLAISDESQTLARELAILSPKVFFEQINNLIEKEQIKTIAVGLPLNMSGEDSEKTREAREFAEQLRTATGLTVDLADERLSSAMAATAAGASAGAEKNDGRKNKGSRRNIDSLAAQIILQNYLNAQSHNYTPKFDPRHPKLDAHHS